MSESYFCYTYEADEQKVGVVHIGVGSFHRAHQAVYFDDLLGKNIEQDWTIAGINLRKSESELVKSLNRRQGKYILKTMSSDGETVWREIHSISKVVDWTKNPEAAYDLILLPSVKLITITVTEGGYYTNDKNNLATDNPLIKEEIETGNNLGSIFGFLRESLSRRMSSESLQNENSITIVCCDNLRHNGKLLKKCFYDYLLHSKNEILSNWLDRHVTFPCSMVDRITPRPTNELFRQVEEIHGISNDPSVMSEDFVQWVIEDKFSSFRPQLEKVGVLVVDDVTPYEDTKIRILNGGHTGLVYMGALKGYTYFDEIMYDEELATFYHEFQQNEVIPALMLDFKEKFYDKKVSIDFQDYCALIKKRFSNKNIGDTIARIAADGASKFPIFILPSTRKSLEMGSDSRASATIIASWYVFLEKLLKGKIPFNYNDSKWYQISPELINNHEINIDKFINYSDLFQDIPVKFPHFLVAVKEQINLLRRKYCG